MPEVLTTEFLLVKKFNQNIQIRRMYEKVKKLDVFFFFIYCVYTLTNLLWLYRYLLIDNRYYNNFDIV